MDALQYYLSFYFKQVNLTYESSSTVPLYVSYRPREFFFSHFVENNPDRDLILILKSVLFLSSILSF